MPSAAPGRRGGARSSRRVFVAAAGWGGARSSRWEPRDLPAKERARLWGPHPRSAAAWWGSVVPGAPRLHADVIYPSQGHSFQTPSCLGSVTDNWGAGRSRGSHPNFSERRIPLFQDTRKSAILNAIGNQPSHPQTHPVSKAVRPPSKEALPGDFALSFTKVSYSKAHT
jgi:hypothetical protein